MARVQAQVQATCSFVDGRLVLAIENMPVEDFMHLPLWKIRLPLACRQNPQVEGNSLVFPADMATITCQKIAASLTKAAQWGLTVTFDDTYNESVGQEANRLREHARVGLAIKAQQDSVKPQFEMFSRVVNEHLSRPLRDKQMWDAFYMCSMGKAANFSVPGSGKTASVLGMYAFLKAQGQVERVLVISPINAFGSWMDEWRACFGRLEACRPLNFHSQHFANADTASKRRELTYGYRKYNLILSNYEATGLADALATVAADKTLVVFDEVHKVKRPGGRRASAALDIAKRAPYTVALTGTPIPNSYEDLYNLLNILYPHDYDWYFGYTRDQLKRGERGMVERINTSIQPFFCRTNKHMLGVPEPLPDHILTLPASPTEQELLNLVRAKLHGDPFSLIIRVLQLESDPEMLLEAVPELEIDAMADNEDIGFQAPRPMEPIELNLSQRNKLDLNAPSTKMDACVDLVSQLVSEGKRVIVWCLFTRTMGNLYETFTQMGMEARMVHGSVPADQRPAILDEFRSGSIDVLITNPQTLAESVSLHSICHDAVYFECNYNLVHLLQSKDRINRLGLPQDQYTQYHFLQTMYPAQNGNGWSLDANIYQRLKEKEQAMLEAIDRGVLEPGSTDKRDLEIVFRGMDLLES